MTAVVVNDVPQLTVEGKAVAAAVDVDGLSESEWCLYHRLPEVVQELAYSIVLDRPDDVEEYSRAWLSDLKRLMIMNGNATCAQGVNLTSVRADIGRTFAMDPTKGVAGVNLIEPGTVATAERNAEKMLSARLSRKEARKSRMFSSASHESATDKQRALIERIMKLNASDCDELAKHLDLIQNRKQSQMMNGNLLGAKDADYTPTGTKRVVTRHNRVFGDLLMISSDVHPLHGGGILPSLQGAGILPPAALESANETPLVNSLHNRGEASTPSAEESGRLEMPVQSGSLRVVGRRRIAVSAAPAIRTDDLNDLSSAVEQLPVIEKSPEELNNLREAMRACTAFSNFEPDQLEKIIGVMHKETFEAGVEILKQGQPGRDTFYLIIDGVIEVLKNGKFVTKMSHGNYFGELELMYSTGGCAATVKSITPLQLYALRKETYQVLLMRQTVALREANLELIAHVEFFKDLSDYNKLVLAEAFSTKTYLDGEKLIRRGEPGEWMHIVVSGEISVVGREEGTGKPFEIVRRGKNDVVGELEFLFNHEAVADVVAVGHVRAARLSRKHFESAIGKTVDVLAATITRGGYENYLKKADQAVIKQIQTSTRKVDRAKAADSNAPTVTIIEDNMGSGNTLGVSQSAAVTSSGSRSTASESNLLKPAPSANGEVIFGAVDGSLYRFPLDPFQDDHICLVGMQEDGTIVHWSDGMSKLTQYHVSDVLGKPIFSLLANQDNQRVCFELITAATEWIGDWDGFQDAGKHKREAMTFTSASQMIKPTLLVTVVPSLNTHGDRSSGVVLLIGHELRRKPPVKSIDFAPWFHSSFAPLFRTAVARSTQLLDPFKLFEGVLPSSADLKELQEQLLGVKNVVDQFEPLVNVDGANLVDNWQPVNVETLFRRIQTNFATEIAQHHNHLEIKIDESLTAGVEVFVDVVKLPEALTRLIHNANKNNMAATITIMATCHRRVMQRKAAPQASPQQLALPAPPGNPYDEPLVRAVSHSALKPPSGAANSSSAVVDSDSGIGIDTIEFAVHDTGTGFSADHLQKLAENPAAKGSGLHNVIKAVQMMGGTYSIKSKPGDTTVSITMPLVELADQSEGAAKGGSTFTTVLVESDTVQRNFFCQYLWGRQHAVLPAQNWTDVMRMLNSSPVDVLIIDPECIQEEDLLASMVQTTSADGLRSHNAIDMLRQQASKSVLIITSETMDEEMLNALALDGVLTIAKPCSAPRFHLVVEKAEGQILRMREEAEKILQMRMTFQQTNRGAWRKGKLLGKGAFGEVYEAIDVLTGGKMAVKIMKNNEDNKALMEEIRTMTTLKHPNIIHYFYCEENKTADTDEINIFMELAVGGVLQNQIKALGRGFDKQVTAKYLRQILAGIAYIHEKGYVHCDIKSANVLMDGEEHCKLGDFGTAKLLQEGQRLYETRGTPLYMAPEVWNASVGDEHGEGRSGYNQSADIWSLGCLVMEMATGKSPWSHLGTPVTVMNRISSLVAGVDDTPDLSPLFEIDVHVFEFVRACLEVDPEKRPTANTLLTLALITESTDTSAAVKVLQKAELMHVLNKFVAFQSPPPSDDDEDTDFFRKFKKQGTGDGDDFFDSDDEDEDESDDDAPLKPAPKRGVASSNIQSPTKPFSQVADSDRESSSNTPRAPRQTRAKTVNFDLAERGGGGADSDEEPARPAGKQRSVRGSLRNLLANQKAQEAETDRTTGEVRRGQSIRREANPFFGAAATNQALVDDDDVVDLLRPTAIWSLDGM